MLSGSNIVASVARLGARQSARSSPSATKFNLRAVSNSTNRAGSATADGAGAGRSYTKDAFPSFTRNLFRSRLETASLFPYRGRDALSFDEASTLSQLVEPVTRFFTEVNNAAENDRNASMPAEVVEGLKALGAFGLQIPEQYGGLGLGSVGYARLVEVVGAHDLGVGIFLGAHQSIGFKGILLHGTSEQQAQYLPKLASGEHVAAFALTEPGAGSDAASIKTRAVPSADGSHWVLNGGKLWISNGDRAEIFTVFAQTPFKDPVNGQTKDKMTAFIVERGFGGVTNGPLEKKMGIKCSPTAEVYFSDTKVPASNVLLSPGQGFKVAMDILNNGRFGMCATLTGTMKALLAAATEHTGARVQFGRKLKDFAGVRAKIATIAARIYGAESLAYALAANMDRGMSDYQLEAAVSKVYGSEAAWATADDTIQLFGGLGFMASLPYERVARDLRIFRIFEGSNPILQQFISLTALRSLAQEDLGPLQAASKSPLSPASFATLAPHMANELRSRMGMPESLTSGALTPLVPSHLQPSARLLEEATAKLGGAAKRLAIKHGKGVVEQQLALERLAEAATDITVASCALSRAARAHTDRLPTAEHEGELAHLLAYTAASRIGHALGEVNSGRAGKLQGMTGAIAEGVYGAGGVATTSPLGF